MASIKRNISTRTNQSGRVEILLRLTISHSISHRIKSGIFVSTSRFKDGRFIMPRDPQEKKEVREQEKKLEEIEKFLIALCEDTPVEKLDKDFILTKLDLYLNPPKEDEVAAEQEVSFFDIFEDYIEKKNISEWRIKHLRVLKRALMRYELYVQANGKRRYKIRLDEFSIDDVTDSSCP